MKTGLEQAIHAACVSVLETMFFTEPVAPEDPDPRHCGPIACTIQCSGAQNGDFTVTIDREAIRLLCDAFYGDDQPSSNERQEELLREFTNMLAGSTLSNYAPEHACRLSSPVLYAAAAPSAVDPQPTGSTTVAFLLDGGLLSISCALRAAA